MDNSMSTTADRLNYLENTKLAIKQALTDKGVTVSDSDTFRSYANKIDEIQSGGGGLVEGVKEPVDLGYSFAKEVWFRAAITKLNLGNCTINEVTDISFSEYSNLESIEFPQGWDTSSVIYGDNMFSGCSSLTSLDLSNWDVSNVIRFNSMFSDCSSLTSLNVSNWNTLKCTSFNNMFSGCRSLTSLDLSNWDASNVTSTGNMFSGCRSLTSLDLSNWDTSSTNLDFIFFNYPGYGGATSVNVFWGNNWASNPATTSFDASPCPLSHDSCLDLFNKLATKSSNATLSLSATTKGYMSEEEIAIATNKGWTVS